MLLQVEQILKIIIYFTILFNLIIFIGNLNLFIYNQKEYTYNQKMIKYIIEKYYFNSTLIINSYQHLHNNIYDIYNILIEHIKLEKTLYYNIIHNNSNYCLSKII